MFTIPYQDMDDGLPHGPDIVPPGHSVLDSDPGAPDILPSYSPGTARAWAGGGGGGPRRYQPPPAQLELEWDNFVGGGTDGGGSVEGASDMESSTGFGESLGIPAEIPGGMSVQYEDDYFGSSADL